MQKTALVFIALLLGIISSGNAQVKQKENHLKTSKNMEHNFNEEQKKVFGTIQQMVAAFEKKDIDGVLETYEDNAIVMFEPQQPVQGKENLRTLFTQFVAMNPKYTFGEHEVYIAEDIATHIAPWHMVGSMPDGTKIEQNGLSVATLRKQSNGKWLMIQDNPHGQFSINK